ncbi:MAG TPA: site-2 protease family protein, partial [Solirubrobacteraceae bacterium]|nr:site-2 protease family protein [Solirubrobacteraceae bacterium]
HWPAPPVPAPARRADEPVPAAAEPYVSPAPPPDTRPWWRRSLSLLVVVGLLALKWGKALLLLLPKVKVLSTSATMLVSIAAYSLIWGWKFALGFVLLLLVHEMGHVIQLRREGIEASAPMFIPFLGAAVMAKSLGDNATAEARVGLAGPILGTLGALALLPVASATDAPFWYALIFTGLFLNLFNLLPVVPLDGGRAMAALSPWMWFVGLFAMAVLTFALPNPIIILILLLAVFETYRRWQARKSGDEKVLAYYKVKPAHRLAILAVYLGLIVVCAAGMALTFVERSIPA